MSEIVPFHIAVPEADLVDLRERLARTRWPERETVSGWEQGVPLDAARDLIDEWRTAHDWRRCEARLNGLPQFRTEIDGCGIHFLHIRSPEPDARPLVLTHGWPGSVIEFLEVIAPLTDPRAHGGDAADAFHLVIPSLPGYGFSDRPAEGWDVPRIARAWLVLMKRLGYGRFFAQGGDWGSAVTTALALSGDPAVAGIHLNMVTVRPSEGDVANATEDERKALADLNRYMTDGNGYAVIQSTRPQTLGYALTDSPAGQAAWIYEKLRDWTDCGGVAEQALSRETVLDNISLYWLTGTAASSARLYHESFRKFPTDPVSVPVACSIFPKELFRASRRWAERRFRDLRYWNELDRGGHFAAWEQPALFVDEVRAGFRTMR